MVLHASRWPGVAALGFAILWLGGVILAAPPGGNYSASDLHDFTASGHRTTVVIGILLSLVGVICLLGLITYLRRLAVSGSSDGSFVWGAGLISVAGFAIGSALIDIVPLGLANGGKPISAPVTYMFTQIGFAAAWGVGGSFLAVTLLGLAVPGTVVMPGWLRWFTVVAGVIGLFSIAFFPFFILIVWAIVTGIWLLVSAPAVAHGGTRLAERKVPA